MVIQLQELSKPLIGLLEKLREGEEIIIQDGNQPIARLQGFAKQRMLGGEENSIKVLEGFDDPLEEFADYQ
jgi:antitoxin (DNA-binding transcriptional repressor) of toxin-antitoxin stability system